MTIFLIFALSSCAREEAPVEVGAKEGKGVMAPILSEEKPVTRTTETYSGDILLVADFNNGTKPSNIGGDFGAWDRDPADFSQTCVDSFEPAQNGFSVKLDYDVDSPNPAYNGFWMKLNNLDASNYWNLVFMVKGDEGIGYTTVFKVELKTAGGDVGKFYISGVNSEWKKISIPLSRFQGISDFSNLGEFVIVFEDTIASNKDGVIYIDDIQFTK